MQIWKNYTDRIKYNCASPIDAAHDLAYWRNNLFSRTIVYLLPFCLISLIPSLYWSIVTGNYILAFVDVFSVVSVIVLAFIPNITINTRKLIFIICIYVLSTILIYYIGLSGPGLLFLLITAILCTLIFPAPYAWGAAIVNLLTCVLFITALSYKLLPLPDTRENSPGQWVAVTSNLVFLSFLSAALIPRLFNGLQQTIDNEKNLQLLLSDEKQSLKNAMQLLRYKNEELEQFAYAASHDLQEPLRMITSFLILLEKKYASLVDDKGKTYIHFAVDGAERMREMILDLLEYSRAGSANSHFEAVNVNVLIDEIKILLKKQTEEKNAVIESDLLPTISVHKAPLKQIFQNIISNALKYSSNSSPVKIKIDFTDTSTHFQFAIRDNGIGIAEEYFERIFVVFQRLHSNTEYPGSGMGLAICKKLVESHHGKIWVKSEDGKGSTFYFTIAKENNF